MKFIHTPPDCYLVIDTSETNGIIYHATCTACNDRGGECSAMDGSCYGNSVQGDFVIYREERAELEAIAISMNPKNLPKSFRPF